MLRSGALANLKNNHYVGDFVERLAAMKLIADCSCDYVANVSSMYQREYLGAVDLFCFKDHIRYLIEVKSSTANEWRKISTHDNKRDIWDSGIIDYIVSVKLDLTDLCDIKSEFKLIRNPKSNKPPLVSTMPEGFFYPKRTTEEILVSK